MKTLSIYICLFSLLMSCSKDDEVLSDLNDITSFIINEQQGVINNNEIILKLDTGTDITALTPIIEHTGLTIIPAIDSPQDFTNPVIYTVVSENGNTQEFTVTVNNLGTVSGIEFITTWSAREITIPTNLDITTYNYNVDWNNDGIVDESGITGDVTHTFDTDGEHTIRITGVFPSIQFGNNNTEKEEAEKIISVDQWGTGIWLSMEEAFGECKNLEVFATDIPDLSNVSSLFAMFIAASSVNPDVSKWDTSNITNLSGMFFSASLANPDISNWNISKVDDAGLMFKGASLSTENYDKLLISFANQTRLNDVSFGANDTAFCSDEANVARSILINESNWRISDDNRDATCL